MVGGQLCDMAYIVPMHVKPKFTYLLTYLLKWKLQTYEVLRELSLRQVLREYPLLQQPALIPHVDIDTYGINCSAVGALKSSPPI